MIEIDLFQQLRDYPGLNALISGRVYPLVAPQGIELPYCVYSKVSNTPQYTHDGRGLQRARFQVSCYAETYLAAKQVAAEVTNALEAFPDAADIQGAQQQNESDLYEESTGLYHIPVDFFIWNR